MRNAAFHQNRLARYGRETVHAVQHPLEVATVKRLLKPRPVNILPQAQIKIRRLPIYAPSVQKMPALQLSIRRSPKTPGIVSGRMDLHIQALRSVQQL